MTKPKTKIIRVTATDIKKGSLNRSTKCAVALALHRAGFINPDVGSHFVWHGPTKSRSALWLPNRVTKFILAFDSGKPVKPFTFRIKI